MRTCSASKARTTVKVPALAQCASLLFCAAKAHASEFARKVASPVAVGDSIDWGRQNKLDVTGAGFKLNVYRSI